MEDNREILDGEREHEEECEWCNSTGDLERTRRLYWSVVSGIVIFVILLYILSYI